MTLDFLCRAYVRNRAPETLEMLTTTLDAMAAGGMYDQLGGGFARYATDAQWLVPHFEKMLYDNALLTRAYLHGFLVTDEPRYRRIVEETVEYVLRDLHHVQGGFFAAEDADSEGIEGKFYLWSLAEVREVAGADADEVIALLRHHRGRKLHRSAHRILGQHPPRPEPLRRTVARGAARPAPRCSSAASGASGPGSTTRCCSGGTRCSSRR